MVIPDLENPGPVKKRPRLSLKARKQPLETCSPAPVKNVSSSVYAAEAESLPDLDREPNHSSSDGESCDSDTDSREGKEKDLRVPAVSSLENLGNTCFMNSVMQVLRYTPQFLDNLARLFEDIMMASKIKRRQKNLIMNQDFDDGNSKKCWKIVQTVYKVYKNMSALESNYEEVASDDVMSMSIKPSKVLSVIREMNSMYEGYMQHDAQEFLRCLLSYLQDAEKEVKSFYRSLPSHPSKVPAMNPIMEKFLGISSLQADVKDNSMETSQTVERAGGLDSSSVKVNLFPKSESDIVEKMEPVKSPVKSSIQVSSTPQLGDTAGVVDEKSAIPVLSGSQTRAQVSADSTEDEIHVHSQTKNVLEPNLKSGSSSRQNRRCKPYDLNSKSRTTFKNSKSEIQCSEKINALESHLNLSNSGHSKTSRVRKSKSPSEEKQNQGNRKDQSPRKSSSGGSTCSLSNQVKSKRTKSKSNKKNTAKADDESQPRIVDAFQTATTKEKIGVEENVVPKSEVLKTDLESAKQEEKQENTKLAEKDQDDRDQNTDKIDWSKNEAKENQFKKMDEYCNSSSSWIDAFAKFVTKQQIEDEDDEESLELISDSDSDIVEQKKIAKQIYDSPRRSPRKSSTSPRKLSSLCSAIANPLQPNSSQVKTNKKELETKTDEPCSVDSESQVLQDNTNINALEKAQKCSPCKQIVSRSPNNLNMKLMPVIKLEKCDYVLRKELSSKSVSANYAERCLSPMKTTSLKKTLAATNSTKKVILKGSDKEVQKGISKALKFYKSPQKDKELMEGLFQGTMILQTKCLNCESLQERREDFHDVSVPVQCEKDDSDDDDDDDDDDEEDETDSNKDEGRLGLMKLIDASMEVERLLEDNKYFCDVCSCYVEAERSIHYEVLPDILTIHLKRFSAGPGQLGYFTKLNDQVDIPMSLPCLRYRCTTGEPCSQPDHRYSLYGLVTHTGATLSSGHYLAYVRSLPKPKTSPTCLSFSSVETGKTTLLNCDEQETGSRRRPTKLPSRFKSSVVTETKVKAFAEASNDSKPSLSDSLKTCTKFSDEWFECDDETVRVFEREEFQALLSGHSGALLGTPYLLFYHKSSIC